MGIVEDARVTQKRNIESSTGRSIDNWIVLVRTSGITKHGGIVAWLKSTHGLTHGNANLIATEARDGGSQQPGTDLIDAQYAGAKASLRPILEALLDTTRTFGSDVEVSPKKTGISLRRHKQFALIEAASATRVVLGLNDRSLVASARLIEAKGMCSHQVSLTSISDVDAEVVNWLRAAYNHC